jgi:hypothetical protein
LSQDRVSIKIVQNQNDLLFHETTTVAKEVIKPKQIDNDEMENKENESKSFLFRFYILLNLIELTYLYLCK